MAQGDTVYLERGVYPVYKSDLTSSFTPSPPSTSPSYPEATSAFIYDVYGYRLFTYRQNRAAATIAVGTLASKARSNFNTVTSPTTTSITKVGQFTTTNRWVGALLNIPADTGTAAPETQTSRVLSHTDDTLTLDPNLPFSVAPLVGDTFELVSPKVIASASGDPAFLISGVSMSTTALAIADWGWFQYNGLHPAVGHTTTTAVARLNTVVAGTGLVSDSGGVAVNGLTVGIQWAANPATAGAQKTPVHLMMVASYE